MQMMTVDLSEVELLSDIVRRVTKLDRKSIMQLKKIEAKLAPKCENLPRERSIDIINEHRV